MKKGVFFVASAAIASALFTGVFFGAAHAQPAGSEPAAAVADENSPRMTVTPETYDFGKIDEGEKPMAVFTIKNTGRSELIIYDAKPSCGCTLAQLSSKNIMPGETSTLEAVYNSQNAHGGKISKYVTVKSNDPVEPSRVLRITGEVKAKPAPVLSLSQYRVDSVVLAPGAMDSRKLQLVNAGDVDLLVTEITATQGISARVSGYSIPQGGTVKMEMSLKPGEARELEIDTAPHAQSGSQFQEALTLRSNSKGRPTTAFLIRGAIK